MSASSTHKTVGGIPSKNNTDVRVSVTFRIPKLIDRILEAYAFEHSLPKNEAAVKALTAFLEQNKYPTDKVPVISWHAQ